MSKFLTKSNYLTGLNCLKSLWYEKHRKYELPKLDEFTKSIMEQGKEIGEFAKKYFIEKSLDIEKIIEKKFSKEDKNFFKEQIELSKKSLTEKKILFEATFVYERLYSRADILKPNEEGSFDLIEVKSGTKPKTENIEDVAFQYFVYTKCNIKIRKCFIMNVNKDYLFKEERINPIDFFYLTDITKKVLEKQEEVENNIKIFLEVVDLKSFDDKYHTCLNLKRCNYKELFNKKMCENDLFSLKGIREEKLLSFKKLGFKNVEELDLSKIEINEKQKIQFELVKNKKKVHIEKENIKYFLKDLKYPIYFLDFETISKAIPLYKNSTPYEQIPFQFSLHIQKEENSNLEHFEFLQNTKEDPRENFIQKILEYVKDDNGSIVVYFEGFEKAILKNVIKYFPKYSKKINKLLDRVFDLHKIFSNFFYYNVKQLGSTSIKKTLPILCPKFSYSNLEIQNGGQATQEFYKMIFKNLNESEKKQIKKNLLEYCKLDTLAMFEILNKIKILIE